jgi:Carboxypeptidase regulatory-like domain
MAVKKDNVIIGAIISAVAALVAAYIGLYKQDGPEPLPPARYSGRVVDESTLRAIPKAKITLDGSSLGTLYSDSDGLFTVLVLPTSQTIRLRIEVDGFETLERNVNVPGSGTEDLRLKPLRRIPSTPIPLTPTSQGSSTPQASPATEPSAVRVWLNRPTGIYHCPGTQWYGRTKDGVFMTEAEARQEGYRPARGQPCAAYH